MCRCKSKSGGGDEEAKGIRTVSISCMGKMMLLSLFETWLQVCGAFRILGRRVEIEMYRLMRVDPYMCNVLEHQVDCLEEVEGVRACLRDYPGRQHFDHTSDGEDNPVHGNLIAKQELPPITSKNNGTVLDRTMGKSVWRRNYQEL